MSQPATVRTKPGGRLSRACRMTLCAAGTALLAWGLVLLVPVVRDDPVSTGGWLVAGPLLHDGVVAAAVVVVATLVRQWLPGPWHAPVAAGLVVSLVVLAMSVPLWWRADTGRTNPGVRTEVWPGVLTLVAAVWVAVFAVSVATTRIHRRPRGPR